MKETIKIMEFLLTKLKEDLAALIEAELMDKNQANEEYKQIYDVVQLLKAIEPKGHDGTTLKNLVEAMPPADKEGRGGYAQTYNFIRILNLAESRGMSLPELRAIILAKPKKKAFTQPKLFN